ncbi:MAG: aminotransferase class V-fold PLP-dependent enzyme [Pseudomonadota bacterium]
MPRPQDQQNEQNTKQNTMWAWHDAMKVRRVINVSGTMTGLGASVLSRDVQTAMAQAGASFVDMHALQARASAGIARLTGAEAGFLTASASAGISLAIAGCMTGLDAARAEALPADPGAKSHVVIQAGHLCHYGAPVETAIRLTGASPRAIGQSTHVMDHQLAGALCEHTAAALYVASHHVVHYGQIPLKRFVDMCHRADVPVIVDAASEYDLTGFLAAGADLVIYSAHKFLGGPTGGIVAGRREAVRAAYLQNIAIGRGMKIGKESIAGAIAAIQAWQTRDHRADYQAYGRTLRTWQAALQDLAGIKTTLVDDPTGNPLQRLQVNINPTQAGATAAEFAQALADQDPAVIVRAHEIDLGYFQLDPCNLLLGQETLVTDTLGRVLGDPKSVRKDDDMPSRLRNKAVDSYLRWQGHTEAKTPATG